MLVHFDLSSDLLPSLPLHKTTGEAVYPSDEPLPPQGLFAALVFTSKCACTLSHINPSPALSLPGVVAFFGAQDIPGENLTSIGTPLYLSVGEEVPCVGMPVGVIVAISDEIANHAASLVQLSYANERIPITTLAQAIAQKSFYDISPIVTSSLLSHPLLSSLILFVPVYSHPS
jgi:xanthine dehydrogenase/oxidase